MHCIIVYFNDEIKSFDLICIYFVTLLFEAKQAIELLLVSTYTSTEENRKKIKKLWFAARNLNFLG